MKIVRDCNRGGNMPTVEGEMEYGGYRIFS
jgi:hypothetical protein